MGIKVSDMDERLLKGLKILRNSNLVFDFREITLSHREDDPHRYVIRPNWGGFHWHTQDPNHGDFEWRFSGSSGDIDNYVNFELERNPQSEEASEKYVFNVSGSRPRERILLSGITIGWEAYNWSEPP